MSCFSVCCIALSVYLPYPSVQSRLSCFPVTTTPGYLSVSQQPSPGGYVAVVENCPLSTVCVLPLAQLESHPMICSVYLQGAVAAFSTVLVLTLLSRRSQHPVKNKLFTTVLDSSINSWDSWFIFNLRKNKHLLLHE